MEKLNIVEIIKRNPEKFKKLYSPLLGNVIVWGYRPSREIVGKTVIEVYTEDINYKYVFSTDGKFIDKRFEESDECMLFPSKDERDWNYDYSKFDPKTLKPFDRVLVRDTVKHNWKCDLFSNIIKGACYPYRCVGNAYICCIPYNDETKHLVGTTEEAPEYYKYLED